MNHVGFYGKVACRGDFVSRDLPQTFIQPWDQWLAAGLQASQRQLGEQWLQAYLVSPLWRFVLAPGVCGPQAVTGVVMPSIDRVGRYFPLTIAQVLDPQTSLAALVGGRDAWFEDVEAVLLATLEEGAAFEAFERAIRPYDPDGGLPVSAVTEPAIGGLQRLGVTTAQARERALAECACAGMSLWWGRGSEHIAPGLMRYPGLPRAEHFAAFLTGTEGAGS